jgi:hypothetical protein
MSDQLRVGRVLATSYRVWFRNLPRLIAIAALLYLPVIAWEMASGIDALCIDAQVDGQKIRATRRAEG